MLSLFEKVCLTGISLMAAVYVWRTREENKFLRVQLVGRDIFLKELKPVEAVYGFVELGRLEERTKCQIRYLTMALESIPKCHINYAKLQRELKRLQNLQSQIKGVKMEYLWDFNLSDLHPTYGIQKSAIAAQFSRNTPPNQCPLEELLNVSPIESTFWNIGSRSQQRKLEKEYFKLKDLYPDISESKLRTTMAYVYNHLKRDIFSITSRRLEKMVRKLIVEDEEQENHVDYEQAEICSICMEEMYSDEYLFILPCNHQFHHNCIRSWQEQDYRCPICRYPQGRNTL